MKRSGNFSTTTRWLFALIIIICLTAPLTQLHAQPNLTFRRVTVNWPTVELYFSVGCDGNPAFNMSKQDFRIYENGVEVKDFTLWCPDPTIPCAISVSLVFDASGSMSGSGNAGAKQAGHAFIDLMDGVIDEATVIWFTSVVTPYQQMTTVKPMLHSAVDALPASGMTAVWDGGYAGLIELINNGVNQCRAVILLTDGGDNSSTRQPSEIIALANRHRIRVFTVGIGSGINTVELELVAQVTGGKFYQTTNAGQLAAMYQEIITMLRQGFQECVITYDRDCEDGALRTVELQLKDFCGGTDTKTKTYRAPLDSSTFSSLTMELDNAVGMSGTDITIPMNLRTPVNGEMFYPFHFELKYDTSCVQLKNATAPTGSLLEGVPITIMPISTGATIELLDRKLLNGSGLLLNLAFRASDRADTCCSDILAVNPLFEQGCFRPVIDTGRICVYPKTPSAFCDITGPKSLMWRRSLGDYQPNPFVIIGRCDNPGDAPLQNARYRIIYDSSDIQLLIPATETQVISPSNIDPGGYANVSWQVAAKRRTVADSVDIGILSSFDNYPDVLCAMRVFIPTAGPVLECAVDVPPITVDSIQLRYTPMPFPLTVTAINTGGTRTDTVWASIVLPPELTLAAPDAPDRYTKRIMPSVLVPQQSGSIPWMLQHAPTTAERNYTVTVWTFASNADSSKCEISVRIPGLPPQDFDIQLTATGPLTFCEGDSVILDAGSGYASYNWQSGERTQQISVTRSGEYSCIVRRADGFYGRSDTVRVTVHPLPIPVITPGNPVSICKGDVVTLRTTGSFAEYEWSTGAKTPDIDVTAAGRYHVRVRSAENCWGISDTVTVTMKPDPAKPVITPGNPVSICKGDVVTLRTTGSFAEYEWSTGAKTPDIDVTAAGRYHVRVRSAENCWGISDTVTVTMKPAPAKPVIRRLGDVIRTDTAHQYQWYRNSVLMPGATGPLLALTQTGVYQVQVTNAEGCSAMSDPFNVTLLGIGDEMPIAERAALEAWPEPATDVLRIALRHCEARAATLVLYDIRGRAEVIYSGGLSGDATEFSYSLRSRDAGVYYLVAVFGESVLVKRVTKM